MITLEIEAFGCYGIINDDNRHLLIQSDWDFPSVARNFGWSLREVQHEGCECEHDGTDGTIDCPDCGVTASEFIDAASAWLDDNEGAEAEDPGYFDQEEFQ